MKARITKIDPPKVSYRGATLYRRVYLQLEDGSWAATDIVPVYKNYARWKSVLESGVGTLIDGVELLTKGKVNADSFVTIVQPTLGV